MKIGNKLIIGFMVIASLVGLVGIFSVISHNNIQTNSKIITEVLELGILLDESLIELLALNQTENIKDYVREKTDYEQIRAEFDALFKKLDEENEKHLQDLGFNIEAFHKDADQLATISNRLIALHKRELAKNKASKEKKSLEKELRRKTKDTLFALQDNALTRDVELMQYKSKEALYQYKDQRHCIEWLDSISKIKDNSLVVPSQDISKVLNAYERVAQDLGKIIIEQKTIEARKHLVLRELQEYIHLLEENTGGIVNKIKAESEALAKNTHLITFVVIAGAFLVSIILGLTIARSISKPVTNLAQTTQAIAQGDFSLRVNIAADDEIGELAASFNDMAGKLKESYTHLEEKVQERTAKLEDEIVQRTSAKKILEERIKEINCLYSLSKLVEQPAIPLGAIFQRTTELIRMAYQYPDFTCVRITFNGVKYKTDNFDKSELSQHAQTKVGGENAGEIEVYYLGDNAESDEGPFLTEESELLDAVAEHLGRIAERRKTGEKLELFRNLIDRSNDSIFLIEPEWGRFLDANDRTCASLGYTREELLTMSFKDIEESIRDESAWRRQTEKLKLKSDLVIQGRHKCKDATAFYAETSLKYVSQGKEDYIIAVARDITERKRAEETLQKSKEFVETIFNSVNDSISVIDTTNFKILGVNRAFLNTLKMEEKDVIGKHCYEVTHLRTTPCGPPDDICPLAETLKTAEHSSVEHIHYDKNRREINVEVSTSPIKNEKGEIYQVVHATRDITERKQAEEKQAGLLETVKSINKELKDFAYIVSHDLKAPLRGIKTLADWITTDYADMFDEEGRERVNLLTGRVVRMHNLIDGILQYSRVGREKVKRVRVNLNELVSEVIEAIVPLENIEIRVENELPIIECEETRIMQVFQNLLSNAVKYMDKPQGRIRIDCVEEDGFWKFSVTDNGPGIEEAHFERIFQIFQTLAPRDEVESTGVGLSVVKKIVELYGGKIWVESKPGEGSTFFFTLPKQESEVVDDAQLEAHIVS